jgi:hypothetical protein
MKVDDADFEHRIIAMQAVFGMVSVRLFKQGLDDIAQAFALGQHELLTFKIADGCHFTKMLDIADLIANRIGFEMAKRSYGDYAKDLKPGEPLPF